MRLDRLKHSKVFNSSNTWTKVKVSLSRVHLRLTPYYLNKASSLFVVVYNATSYTHAVAESISLLSSKWNEFRRQKSEFLIIILRRPRKAVFRCCRGFSVEMQSDRDEEINLKTASAYCETRLI